jgi:formylglycine-generating enzyme required for sulfatase activity
VTRPPISREEEVEVERLIRRLLDGPEARREAEASLIQLDWKAVPLLEKMRWSSTYPLTLFVDRVLNEMPISAWARDGEYIREKDGMVMVWIPPGEMPMPNIFIQPGNPQRPVHIDGFFIDRFCVTKRMFVKFLNETGVDGEVGEALLWNPTVRSTLRYLAGKWEVPPGFDNHPAARVPGNLAWNYVSWAGVRLPTVAQWERAAGAENGRWYPWGNEPCTLLKAYTHGLQMKEVVPVWWYAQGDSPFGVRQLSGNVSEYMGDSGGWAPHLVVLDENGGNPVGFQRYGQSPRITLKGGEYDEAYAIQECKTLCYCCPVDPRGFRCALGHEEILENAVRKILESEIARHAYLGEDRPISGRDC